MEVTRALDVMRGQTAFPTALLHYLLAPLCLLVLLVTGFTRQTASTTLQMAEICDNARDDDGDGLIDLNDGDCDCRVPDPVSLIPNPSFEQVSCCPNGRSQLGCAREWDQASAPTTDLIGLCGWLGFPNFIAPLPFPDGDNVVGFRDGRPGNREEAPYLPQWKEYAGACLKQPMQGGNVYRFDFDIGFAERVQSPPINVTFFGATSCDALPFGDGEADFGCPTNGPGWINLGSVYADGGAGNRWIEVTVELAMDQDIHAIAVGPACATRISDGGLYYYFDNLILADEASFPLVIEAAGSPCMPDYQLRVPERGERKYQWYKNGIALIGENTPVLPRMYGDGTYEVVVNGTRTCERSLPFEFRKPVIRNSATATVCPGDIYQFGERAIRQSGTYRDTFRASNNCDSIVDLDVSFLTEEIRDTSVKIFPGESFTTGRYDLSRVGTYDLTLRSIQGCDSLVALTLGYYELYFPTAFSPNGDGVNDLFSIGGDHDLIEVVRTTVYDRWGNTVFVGKDEWDGGVLEAKPAAVGSYVYRIRVLMDDGKERDLSGTILLVR